MTKTANRLNGADTEKPAETQEQKQSRVWQEIMHHAHSNGFEIVAEPRFTGEGRVVAVCGIIPRRTA